MDNNIVNEAIAFDSRIKERIKNGFVADIRNYKKCEYFYKSCWRDPYFVNLYMGEQISKIIAYIEEYVTHNTKNVLDIGCGAGYFSLELYREGYNVTAIDISSECIKIAKNTLENSEKNDKYGSLKYIISSLEDFRCNSKFDVILFSGSLHHFSDITYVINKAKSFLHEGGIIVCLEPCHELWTKRDAVQVAFIRALLSLTGNWYEENLDNCFSDKYKLNQYVEDILNEYKNERDKIEENGQSPNDNSVSGTQILNELDKKFARLVYEKGTSYIYRMLGGIRGEDTLIYKIADLLCIFDKYSVENGFMNSNSFYYVGRNI